MKVDQLVKNLRHIEVHNESFITKKEFNELYGYPKRPVLLKRAFQDWHIKDDWKTERLMLKFDQKALIESIDSEVKKKITLREYIESGDRNFYFRETLHPNSELFQSLFIKHHQLNLFNCWYESYPTEMQKKCFKWLYIGNEGTYTDIHRDVWRMGSWLYLIQGVKLWFIYPKNYNKIIEKNKKEFGIMNMDDMMNNNGCKPMVAIQKQGEMMYVPSETFHWVYNIEQTVSYTGNFLNELNYEDVRGYFSDMNNLKNKRFIEKIIIEGFKTIDQKSYAIKN